MFAILTLSFIQILAKTSLMVVLFGVVFIISPKLAYILVGLQLLEFISSSLLKQKLTSLARSNLTKIGDSK